MTTATKTLTLPPTRNLAPYGYNETEDVPDENYYREIEDAICAGKVLSFLSSEERHGNGTPKQEVSVTRYRDPRAAELRYAVEIWNEGRTGKYDYADVAAANQSAEEWTQLIHLQPPTR
ncbi:hypothetical protein ACFQ6C_26550 [Streptomyces sp. NPDC056454]|uniref:hypothetical protein n=1 Tax=Streptomyces sp. NPDC056454 TaxID=3345823 RepID=UPI0036AEDD7F